MTLLFEKKQVSENQRIVLQVLQELISCGVKEICVCPSARNAPFVIALDKMTQFKQYFWPEERSAAFFALGRCKLTQLPTVVITTSGTAAGELLPAAMEAYYAGLPLILLTTDRPRSFRGTGAPQAAEQVGLFGQYATYEQDIALNEECTLKEWKQNGAAHINVCLDEPLKQNFDEIPQLKDERIHCLKNDFSLEPAQTELNQFLQKSRYPFVVVSAIEQSACDSLVRFLKEYNAPVYLEGASHLREDKRLSHLRIIRTENIWKAAREAHYPIDGILRIGGVPTFRLWRDLDDLAGQMHVCSISANPFSGLHWGTIQCTPLNQFFNQYQMKSSINEECHSWITADRAYTKKLLELFNEEPYAEASLVYQLSKRIPSSALIYLGNSLPIREWDAYAENEHGHLNIFASRGVNGIDGQLSTFFGMCQQHVQNWGIMGDLTTMYDLVGPWILNQMPEIDLNIVVINNGGGKIFAKMFPLKKMQNRHQVKFKPLADLWNLHYEHYTQLPEKIPHGGHHLIELVPDEESTLRFWERIAKI